MKFSKEEMKAFGTKNEKDNLCGKDVYEIIFYMIWIDLAIVKIVWLSYLEFHDSHNLFILISLNRKVF